MPGRWDQAGVAGQVGPASARPVYSPLPLSCRVAGSLTVGLVQSQPVASLGRCKTTFSQNYFLPTLELFGQNVQCSVGTQTAHRRSVLYTVNLRPPLDPPDREEVAAPRPPWSVSLKEFHLFLHHRILAGLHGCLWMHLVTVGRC